MERLTENQGGWYSTYELASKCVNRLGAYEDTGLTPEQIVEMDRLYRKKCEEAAKAEPYIRLAEKLNVCDLVNENGRLSVRNAALEIQVKKLEKELDLLKYGG